MNDFALAGCSCLYVCVFVYANTKVQGTEVVTPLKKTTSALPGNCLWVIKPSLKSTTLLFIYLFVSMIHEKRENKTEVWGGICRGRHIQGHVPR